VDETVFVLYTFVYKHIHHNDSALFLVFSVNSLVLRAIVSTHHIAVEWVTWYESVICPHLSIDSILPIAEFVLIPNAFILCLYVYCDMAECHI